MSNGAIKLLMTGLLALCVFAGCGFGSAERNITDKRSRDDKVSTADFIGTNAEPYNLSTRVADVMNDAAFSQGNGFEPQRFGRLIFPVNRYIDDSLMLKDVGDILIWYNHVNPRKTVEIVNYLKEEAISGKQIFYPIYTEAEMKSDSWKKDTGLFFFRGKPGAKTAILNAGGGFSYVGAIHDSFPHALELSRQGYNAFALIYRPDTQKACEDLARAIAFLHEHAAELGIDMKNYSLWGGSAGARMAAWLGSFGTEYFGEKSYPQPAAVIMQYTGLSEVYGNEPPTYNCVGTSDGIASYRIMERRIERIKAQGTSAEIEIFPELPHGFGLGEGTIAEGWLNRAANFWEKQAKI